MANKFPYIASGGPITQTVEQFRKSFPQTVDADTLRKLGIASKNESYLINILRFLGLIGEDGGRTKKATDIFTLHDDQKFKEAFSELVKEAYGDLFELQGDASWNLENNTLITFFRQSDQTTDIVGRRQANTFSTLATIGGKRAAPQSRVTSAPAQPKSRKKKTEPSKTEKRTSATAFSSAHTAVGLTVRIEVNLPAQGDQDTYDRIFKSIRDNLLNG